MHEIPAGRCRVLALALALSPSDTCSHSLEIATEQVCDCRAKLKGIGDRRAGAGDEDEVAVVDLDETETEEEEEEETDAGEEEKEEEGDDEVEIIGEVKPKPKEDASTLFEELGLPPPPPGATDEAIARMLADALALAAARGARDERRREDDSSDGDVEVVGIGDGIVAVRMFGACGTCSSSTATLKGGIEATLFKVFGREAIKEVVNLDQGGEGGKGPMSLSVEKMEEHLKKLEGAIHNYGGSVKVVEVESGVVTLAFSGPLALAQSIASSIKGKFPLVKECKIKQV